MINPFGQAYQGESEDESLIYSEHHLHFVNSSGSAALREYDVRPNIITGSPPTSWRPSEY